MRVPKEFEDEIEDDEDDNDDDDEEDDEDDEEYWIEAYTKLHDVIACHFKC